MPEARAATVLADDAERLRLATEHAEIGFWDVEEGHGTLTWPPRVKAMFGISADRPVTMDDFYAGLHADDRERVAEAYASAADPVRRALYDVEYRTMGKEDGLLRWVAAKGRGVFDGDGPRARCLRVIGTAIDVTARKATEAALAESEARFRNMADHAPVMMWTTDPSGACTYLNHGWYEFTGQCEEEALGLGWLEATHPDDKAESERIFLDANERQAPFRLEYRLRRADGAYRWAIDAAAPRFGLGGEFLGYIGSVIDITERREAEEALQGSEAALRELNGTLELQVGERTQERDRIWRLSRDLMCVARTDGTLLSVNPAWERVLGWPLQWLTGRNAAEIKHSDDAERTAVELARLAEGHPSLSFEDRYRHENGSWRWIAWTIEPENQLIYCIGRDVTDEKARQAELRAAEAARREADALYRAYFENTAEALFVVGVLPDGGFIVEDLNPAHQAGIGFPLSDVVGKRLEEILPPEMAEVVMLHYRRVIASGEVYQYREVFDVKGEDTHWDTVLVPVRGADGEIVRIIGSSRNLTAQVIAEEALRQSQKMEAVGQLTGGLAHDFNNLLSGISGSLELMGARIAQGRIADVERYLIAAEGAAKRAAALTHRLLAFSRRQTLEPKVTGINSLVAGMEELIRRTVGPAVDVESVAGGGLWNVLVDPNQLESALLNLAINARDAMPDGGKLTIETGNRWLDERAARERDLPPGQYVSLCVSDSGTGMAADVIAKAFDPFFTTKPIGEGTGLGLSMVYGFARQSGGQVRIYSEVGQGTMVCLYLPRHLGEAEDDGVQAETDMSDLLRSEPGKTVLVIDDEAVVRMLIVDVLEELGYAVLEAGDGPSGLKVLQSGTRVDLLVTDVGLPGGLNGRQVADAARALRPGLKVLFITGYAENAVLNHGHLDHGMQVMTKPFTVEELSRRIKAILSGD